MIKAGIIYIILILLGMSLAGAVEANNVSNFDWLGTPIYSYGGFANPYYYPFSGVNPQIYTYTPTYSDPLFGYSSPYYYRPYWITPYSPGYDLKEFSRPWWIGGHSDLPKVLSIARSSSSVRVYANGYWQTP